MSHKHGLGGMDMPPDFPYRGILEKGRPSHDAFDPFLIRHPPMPVSRRAKIFAPFDALRGFSERVANKETQYVPRMELSEEKKEALDRRLSLLQRLIRQARAEKRPGPAVCVQYYVPCEDEENDAFGRLGTYRSIEGTVTKLDTVLSRTVRIGGQTIPLRGVSDIEILRKEM